MPTFTSPHQVLDFILTNTIETIDIKFVDIFGQWHHFSLSAEQITLKTFTEGIRLSPSFVEDFADYEKQDMNLILDISTAFLDTFAGNKVLSITGSMQHSNGTLYANDPRAIAQKTIEFIQASGVADTVNIGSELECYIFDSIAISQNDFSSKLHITPTQSIIQSNNTDEEIAWHLGASFPVAPFDNLAPIRQEIASHMKAAGLTPEKQHHEDGAAGQCEINFAFDTLQTAADNAMLYKYIVKNISHKHQKIATFLPKPLVNQPGSGMHVNISFMKDGKNIFAPNPDGSMSLTTKWAIGGVLHHLQSLIAFTNPLTNSYARFGYSQEAFLGSYSDVFRDAMIRIPRVENHKQARIECRFPDCAANPYIAFSLLALAMMDGIIHKRDPGQPLTAAAEELNDAQLHDLKKLPLTLWHSLDGLKKSSAWLVKTGIFSQEFINMWIDAKEEELAITQFRPTVREFQLYQHY